jgi:hypothetical protein
VAPVTVPAIPSQEAAANSIIAVVARVNAATSTGFRPQDGERSLPELAGDHDHDRGGADGRADLPFREADLAREKRDDRIEGHPAEVGEEHRTPQQRICGRETGAFAAATVKRTPHGRCPALSPRLWRPAVRT